MFLAYKLLVFLTYIYSFGCLELGQIEFPNNKIVKHQKG